MKVSLVVALIVTMLPAAALAGGASENSTRERRVCTQITLRAGSHMSGRRLCRTPAEWREALGPDWRQRLTGSNGLQNDYEAMATRSPNSWDGSGGIRPDPNSPGAHAPDPGGIPH